MKTKLYNLLYVCLVCCVITVALISCEDMMDTESPRVAYDDQHHIDNANDSIYSVIGILAQLQQVADRIVLMGELRGDLMAIDPQAASTDLQDIDRVQFSADNTYAQKRDFYAIINNCNYILAHMDTTIIEGQTRVMIPEYAQVKTLRAYTYWQMALIFGRVNYFTEPLLSVSGMSSCLDDEKDLDALSLLLIDDLSSVAGGSAADIRPLDYGTVDGWNSAEFFLPTRMLLGDLYLYNNRYEEAAQMYYDLIRQRRLTVSNNFATTWQTTARQELNNGHLQAYRDEVVTRQIFDSNLRSLHSQLRQLTYSDKPSLLPAKTFTDWMQQRTHFHTDNGQAISRFFNGDLRGVAELSNGKFIGDAFGPVSQASNLQSQASNLLITKYYNNLSGSETDLLEQRPLTSLAVLRPSTVYLRYAEAINRAGYPTTAFAVLKYGLNALMYDTIQHRVDTLELQRYPAYIDFRASQFDQNIGTAARGLGLGIRWDREQYIIPVDADTTDFVERAILDEMAAETCFEGNRFFDLLRTSHHRADHPRLLFDIVSRKHVLDPRLLTPSEWFAQ